MKQGKRGAAWAVAVALVLGACGGNRHQNEVAALESAAESMVAASEAYAALPQDSIDAIRNWAMAQLRDFELLASDSGVILTREEGRIINEVSKVRRLLKDNPERVKRLRDAQDQVAGQIHLLADALRAQATIDGAGTPIDSSYIRLHVAAEQKAAESITSAWEETISYAEQALALGARTRPQSDSLGTELRRRLAVWLLENSPR
jgi:hypothetical protein